MQVYNIIISEEQRKLLEDALHNWQSTAKQDRGGLPLYDEEAEEVSLLRDMLNEMPQHEEEDPGVLHGFCL